MTNFLADNEASGEAAIWFENIPTSIISRKYVLPKPKRPPPLPVVVHPFAAVTSSEAVVNLLRAKLLEANPIFS